MDVNRVNHVSLLIYIVWPIRARFSLSQKLLVLSPNPVASWLAKSASLQYTLPCYLFHIIPGLLEKMIVVL